MEFPFDVSACLGAPSHHDGPYVGRVLQGSDSVLGKRVFDLVDAVCEKSALARGLVTSDADHSLPPFRGTEDRAYIVAEGCDVLAVARVGVRDIMALPPTAASGGSSTHVGDQGANARTAIKGGYAAWQGTLEKIRPTCLLDFYVVKGLQRRGLGRLLFDAVLEFEGRLVPSKIAYYRPSSAIQGFLAKHFDCKHSRMASGFMLFDDLFEPAPNMPSQPLFPNIEMALPPAIKPQEPACGKAVDEPRIEEEDADIGENVDQLLVYKSNEDDFYSQRAKLYCFNADVWQEAGVGHVHLLRQTSTDRVRLVFQQEATKKIIANHFLVNCLPFCDLQRHSGGNEKTWMWLAKERIMERRFALRFRTSEEGADFKQKFDLAKESSADDTAVEYVVVHKVGVTAELSLSSRHIKLLRAGKVVRVQEVSYLADDHCARGRTVNPPGWITILSHSAADTASYAVMRADLDSYCETLRSN